MKLKFLDKISFLRAAGIRKYIFLDVFSSHVKLLYAEDRSRFYSLRKPALLEGFSPVAGDVCHTHGDLSVLHRFLKAFIEKYRIEDAVTIIGISEFKFTTLSLPKDIEDKELWFLENSSKFLPEGRPKEEFIYTFEKFREDENSDYYLTAIARADYINSLMEVCTCDQNAVGFISPFPLSVFILKPFFGKNVLFLDFQPDKITCSFINDSGSILFRDLYNDALGPGNSGVQEIGAADSAIDTEALRFSLREIYQAVSLSSDGHLPDELEIYCSSAESHKTEIKEIIRSVFSPYEAVFNIHGTDSSFTSSILQYNLVLSGFGSRLNFMPAEKQDTMRFQFEKKLNLRTVLLSGTILLSLLFVAFLSEQVLSSRLAAGEENSININMRLSHIEKLKSENLFLNKNLTFLKQIKSGRADFSKVLFSLSKTINKRSCFTSVNIAESGRGYQVLEIMGLSCTQLDVADLIACMEAVKNFREVSLLYSSMVNPSEVTNKNMSDYNYFQFKISAKYYAY